jgi:putative (di)nucleoside polyphosphate hydrolase
MTKLYRPNVGIVIFNRRGEVLQGERMDYLGTWQFPQGGIDEGEEPLAGAYRELYEEVGIKDATFVYEYPEWLTYDFPIALQQKFLKQGKKFYHGQTQRWFLFFWDQPVSNCNLQVHDREFHQVKFVPTASALDTVADFKRAVYQKVMEAFVPKIHEYCQALETP